MGLIVEPRVFPVANAAGELIPAHSVARISGLSGGVIQIAKPAQNNQRLNLVVVPQPIPILDPQGNPGKGVASQDWPLIAKYTGTDPSVGDWIGAASSAWTLTQAQMGFVVLGVDTTSKLVAVRPVEADEMIFKTQAAINADASGYVKRSDALGNVSGAQFSARNIGPGDTESGDKVTGGIDEDGLPFFDGLRPPA